MSSRESAAGSLPSPSPWVLTALVLVAVLLVGGVGPETYFGVSEDTITWGIVGLFVAWMLVRRSSARGTAVETDPATPAEAGEHYRPTGNSSGSGVYRVVGAGDEIALLRVADADGRRRHTGTVRHVDQSTLDGDFEAATDPDAGRSPVAAAGNLLSGLYWNVRKFF